MKQSDTVDRPWEATPDAIQKLRATIAAQQKQIDELRGALDRLVLAFDVGDMCHTTLNGRGYAAIDEARAVLDKYPKG